MKETKVFSHSYQLSLNLFHRTKAFPKALRPTLGRKLEEAAIDLLVSLREAGVVTRALRIKALQGASKTLDEIRILCQLAKDLKVISTGSYGEVSEITSEIGKEIGGFLRHERKKYEKQVSP